MSDRPAANQPTGAQEGARLARNLSSLRRRAGLSRDELAFLASMSPARLARMEEDGGLHTGLDVWVRLAGTLDVGLDDLLDGVVGNSAECGSAVRGGMLRLPI